MSDVDPGRFADVVRSDMRLWLERAVIGLNLCPFAKAVHVRELVHCAVSLADNSSAVLDDLERELQDLSRIDAALRDTTLLVLPNCLADFTDFNDFLTLADRMLHDLKQDGVIQIASFHPYYQFVGTSADEITNYTNRAPYPTLHLLREASVERAVQAFPQAESIFENNLRTMERLGAAGWSKLGLGRSALADKIASGATEPRARSGS